MKTSIIPPRVALVDNRTGNIAREWFLFLLALRSTSDATTVDVAALTAQLAQINALVATGRRPPVPVVPNDVPRATNRAQADIDRLTRRVAELEALLLPLRKPNDSDYAQLVNGDLGVGTRVPASGSPTNKAAVTAGVFRTVTGAVASTSAVAVTLANIGLNTINGTYLVSAGLSSADPANYSAVSIVSIDNNVLRATALQTAGLLTIGLSGTNIQATQSSGGAQTLYFTLTRIS